MKKSWRRIRPSQNGAGVEFDLRPRGKREYYPIKKEAEAAARIARVQHERGKVVVTSAVLPSARYYLAASALYGEWRWEPAIGLRRTKRRAVYVLHLR
jgi:hypothetical protein